MQNRNSIVINVQDDEKKPLIPSKNSDTAPRVKQLLSLINETLVQMSEILSHVSPSLNVKTIAAGWPEEQHKVIMPASYAGLGMMFIGVLNAMADQLKSQKTEKLRQYDRAIMVGMTAWVMSLRSAIAAYVFFATDMGKKPEEVDSSLATFLALVGASGAVGLGHSIYSILKAKKFTPSRPLARAVMQTMGFFLQTVNAGATIHSAIVTMHQNVIHKSKDTLEQDPTTQLVIYGISLSAGAGVAATALYAPEKMNTIMKYVVGMTFVSILVAFNTALREQGHEDDANFLAAMWFLMTAIMPVMTKLLINSYQCYQHRNENEMGTRRRFPQMNGEEAKGLAKFGLHASKEGKDVIKEEKQEIQEIKKSTKL